MNVIISQTIIFVISGTIVDDIICKVKYSITWILWLIPDMITILNTQFSTISDNHIFNIFVNNRTYN